MLKRRCPHCGGFPTADELGLTTEHRGRLGRSLVYEALREHGNLTIDQIRMVLWPDGRKMNKSTVNVFLVRMDDVLNEHGIAILKGIGRNCTYRLGSA